MFRPPRDRQSSAPPPDTLATVSTTSAPAVTIAPDAPTAIPDTAFTLQSSIVVSGGMLPATYTCDGASATLPLAWSNAPAGTVSYAVIMHHEAAPNDIHWYWVLYDIPADVTQLVQNSSGIGTLGTNSVNDRPEYAPPCSKGPGPKRYTYTVYALSAQPQVPAGGVNRETLLTAIADITLASATLDVIYSRP